MKHRRSIELGTLSNQPQYPIVGYPLDETFEQLEQWYVLGVRCGRCGRYAVLDRYGLAKKWGKSTVISSLANRLRCQSAECDNRYGNTFWLGKLPR